ncbi:MAG: NAD(+) diphosphatase [Aestuariivirgaceae bacterium]
MPDGKTLGFAYANLDRSAVERVNSAWVEQQVEDPATRFVCFCGDRPVIDIASPDLRIARFTRQQASDLTCDGDPVLLGVEEAGDTLFAMETRSDDVAALLPETYKLIDLRSLAMQGSLPPHELGLLAQARSLVHWHARHRFCAVCGAATEMAEAGYRRHCNSCEADHFPRTDPVVIIVVIRNGRCLLGRGANFPEGVYSALAGFVEPGETMEDAARREVLEESGIKIGKVEYLLSQPWPFPSTLMIGLIGEALNDDIVIDPLELEDARWFELAELKQMLTDEHPGDLKAPTKMAIAHHLLIEAIDRLG